MLWASRPLSDRPRQGAPRRAFLFQALTCVISVSIFNDILTFGMPHYQRCRGNHVMSFAASADMPICVEVCSPPSRKLSASGHPHRQRFSFCTAHSIFFPLQSPKVSVSFSLARLMLNPQIDNGDVARYPLEEYLALELMISNIGDVLRHGNDIRDIAVRSRAGAVGPCRYSRWPTTSSNLRGIPSSKVLIP